MKELKEWYDGIDQQQDVAPNGLIKIKVPAIDADSGEQVIVKPESADGGCESSDDPVVERDKHNSLKAFIYAKRIQDLLVRVAGLVEPYEEDSEERQKLVDKVRIMHQKLGEEIASL